MKLGMVQNRVAHFGRDASPRRPRTAWQAVPTCYPKSVDFEPCLKLAVIILNWNQAAATIRCLEALRICQRVKPEVWVVDNASRDNSHELIPRAYPSVSFIYNPVNLGFAGGNNVALRKIIAGGTDAVLLLNNDAVIGEELVMHLLAKLRDNPRLGMVGPLLEEQQGSRRIIVAGGRDMARYPRTRIVRNSAIPEGRDGQPVYPADVDSLSEVDYVPGAAVMIRTDVLRKIGLFDEDYFFSGEMADLCRRAHEAGWTCAVLQDALAIHQPAGGSLRDTLYLYYSLRNRFLFVRKHESESRRLLSAFWFVCGILMAILAFVRGRPARMRAVWLALCDGLAGRYGNRNCLFGV